MFLLFTLQSYTHHFACHPKLFYHSLYIWGEKQSRILTTFPSSEMPFVLWIVSLFVPHSSSTPVILLPSSSLAPPPNWIHPWYFCSLILRKTANWAANHQVSLLSLINFLCGLTPGDLEVKNYNDHIDLDAKKDFSQDMNNQTDVWGFEFSWSSTLAATQQRQLVLPNESWPNVIRKYINNDWRKNIQSCFWPILFPIPPGLS